ncbi:unnamed protein product [Nesidiocoris tenuis]|uniref:Ig-like domain-containing protein n=1 Tax=Nesidiocoris tenuis TaxID=355587 RepID=A0A6H5FXH5_9HEMI|nr:unnamed protein product [Nesidiocoris tenuis]
MDEHVLRGNAAVFKCHIPSFVADFVFVSSWLRNDDAEILPDKNYGLATSRVQIRSARKLLVSRQILESAHTFAKLANPSNYCAKRRHTLSQHLDPVGSKAPSFPSESSSSTFRRKSGQSLEMLCQAQAYPLPTFRCNVSSENTGISAVSLNPSALAPFEWSVHRSVEETKYSYEFAGAIVFSDGNLLSDRHQCRLERFHPIYRSVSRSTGYPSLHSTWNSKNAITPSMGSFFPYKDPLGSKAPTVPAKDLLNAIRGFENQVVTGLCEAQGFPIPSFRTSWWERAYCQRQGEMDQWLRRIFSHRALRSAGLPDSFVQDKLWFQPSRPSA